MKKARLCKILPKPNRPDLYDQYCVIEIHNRRAFRRDHPLRAMSRSGFKYYRDPLFLTGCMAYAVNRWLVKPHVHRRFFHDHFNDCWLIPCALPLVLWLHRRWGLREHDDSPRISEIITHLIFWSLLFKGVGPTIYAGATADPWDVLCYWGGGLLAWLWWHREWLPQRLTIR